MKNAQNIPPPRPQQLSSSQFVAQNPRPKKDLPDNKPSSYELKQKPTTSPPLAPVQPKKLSRRSSKPIINWFQRKLAGTVRARSASEGDNLRLSNQRHPSRRPSLKDRPRKHPAPPAPGSRPIHQAAQEAISLNETQDGYSSAPDDNREHSDDDDQFSINPSSLARESTWSPAEADDNASLRPLPPSAPPSPSPSRSSSSYLSDPRTFRSMAASTKPTTVLSVDLTGGVAHIAQAPVTPVSTGPWFSPHVRSSSTATSPGLNGGGSITFSALPPSPQSSRPSSVQNQANQAATNNLRPVQAPQHTAHHPRNNPRPSSPPSDNASVLTLASSAFGFPGARIGVNALAYSAERSLRGGAGDSISHISASHFLLGEDDRYDMERDVDASVRALRPRSSRRGSWESEESGWSADGGGYSVAPGTPIGTRERSLWTANSIRTGDMVDEEDGENEDGDVTQSIISPPTKEEADGDESTPVPETSSIEEKTGDRHDRRATDATTRPYVPPVEPFVLSEVEKTPQLDDKEEIIPKPPKEEEDKILDEPISSLRPSLGAARPSDLSELDIFHTARSTPLPQ